MNAGGTSWHRLQYVTGGDASQASDLTTWVFASFAHAERGISLALQHRNRVGRTPLFMPVTNLQKLLIMALGLRQDPRSSILECRGLLSTLAPTDSLIPQMETTNRSQSPVPDRDVERQLLQI
jgi:hypothetical protein